ncbi:unnamed protein product [Microthlaspi erraticum]|uniref:F-box domain-containing protein n=1 Tax=Microthlaspi erraticum TaxID=1685480 RepID=A0A6D2HH90_9BRAS|nr:unnamed protein product [Microthlaspi erraticum]
MGFSEKTSNGATLISDLPRDLAEEVLSRLPVTSLRGARSTCKKLNTLTKTQSFTKKHIGEAKKKQRTEFQVVMVLEYKLYLYSVNLLCDPSLERIVDPTQKFLQQIDRYALGYERKSSHSLRSYKVLRFMDDYDSSVKHRITEFEIYSLDSDSWKVVHVNPDWDIEYFHRGVSLKGNTYWYAQEKIPIDPHEEGDISDQRDFLLCFDFTTERFGPRLPLPFHCFGETVTLSSVERRSARGLVSDR